MGLGWKKTVCATRSRDLWIGLELVERLIAQQVPEIVAAFQRLHHRDQAAHAVAYQHHLIEDRITLIRIEVLA